MCFPGKRSISLILGCDPAGIVSHDAAWNIWTLLARGKRNLLRSCWYGLSKPIVIHKFMELFAKEEPRFIELYWSDIMATHWQRHLACGHGHTWGPSQEELIAYHLSVIACGMWKPLNDGSQLVLVVPAGCSKNIRYIHMDGSICSPDFSLLADRYLSTPALVPRYILNT